MRKSIEVLAAAALHGKPGLVTVAEAMAEFRRDLSSGATKAKAWVFKEPLVVAPVFTAETPKGTSHMNQGETQTLVGHALRYLRNGGKEESLGIISPYDSQVKLLRRMLQKQGVRTGLHGVEVNSVDGFQGREKEDLSMERDHVA
eukprot:s5177_g1.t1